eukprot:NODE_1918_length_529_cov_534.116667_g1560_i0.p1 GENE.NODE_1918_length_529_cov_534.116667_g1560_i0~~NODE_1918_length_529_cov_534.116667_g1560_i0.p1  ORF type:complete len:157 (-),score=21.58 NODE_1918_length_529_cov_534.116667_g1560_i0:57-506(-)
MGALAANRFRIHVEAAWDEEYGGVYRGMHIGEEPIFDKVLWAQEEVLIGTMMIIEHRMILGCSDTDELLSWAVTWFEKMYCYVMSKYPLREHNIFYKGWKLGGNRAVDFEENYNMGWASTPNRKDNYHHDRHLMLVAQSLQNVIDHLTK